MKILDIFEDTNEGWLTNQIKELPYAITHFNNLVEIKGYNQALNDTQDKINLSKSADWFYEMLSQTDPAVNSKYTRLIAVRNKLQHLINSGISYE